MRKLLLVLGLRFTAQFNLLVEYNYRKHTFVNAPLKECLVAAEKAVGIVIKSNNLFEFEAISDGKFYALKIEADEFYQVMIVVLCY